MELIFLQINLRRNLDLEKIIHKASLIDKLFKKTVVLKQERGDFASL